MNAALSQLNRHLAEIYPNSVTSYSNIYHNSLTKRIYAQLNFTLTSLENEVDMESEYFGSEIQIKIKPAESKNHSLRCHITIMNENGLLETDKILNHKTTYNLINKVIKLINTYVKSRPFTIVRYSRGQHKLLDPNGMDYIGQYVTLNDAKKTSFNNYLS